VAAVPQARVTRLHARVDTGACVGCGRCVQVCPAGAIALGPDQKAGVDPALCRGCAACVQQCPKDAISLVQDGGARVQAPWGAM
jgi:ferredoxin